MSYITLKNLTKAYAKNKPVVKSIDLEIQKGEFLVLLGPSGCGKTTTMRMIAGLEEVTQGEIHIDGVNVSALPPKDRGIGMIFQNYAVWPHMSVYNNIAYALKLQKLPKDEISQRVAEAAGLVEMKEYLDRMPSQLSGGQRQRVAVARAVAVKPKVFLMDEPLSNLDAKLRDSTRTQLKEIHTAIGATTIFVTHDQAEAMSLADRIVVMREGGIEQVGEPEKIYTDSASVFVAGFIGAPPANLFDGEIRKSNNFLTAVFDKTNLELTGKQQEKLASYLDKCVKIGARPENIRLVSGDEADFAAQVRHVELQGSYSIVVAELAKQDFKFIVDRKVQLHPGDELSFCFLNQDLLFFDPETLRRIV